MKKILYVTTVSSTINAFLVPHIKYLINQGNTVDIATSITDDINTDLIKMGVKVYEVDFQRTPISLKNSKANKQIKEIQQKEKYDIVHVHTPVASFVTRYALRKNKNLKMIYTCHGFHFYKGGSMINWLLFYPVEKIAAKWTDSLITINTEDYEVASSFKLRNNGQVNKINGVGIDKEKYIIENFDKSQYRKKLGLNDDDFVILVLSELNKNKNHIQLIKAMNLLKDKYPKIKALFAGVGPLEEEIKKQIKEYGLEDKITLLGWRNDVKELINLSDLGGLFSKREGLGKCILESMICGKCVISTNSRGPRELIEHNSNGFIFEIGDIEATSKYIENIYVDTKLKQSLESKVIDTTNKYLLDNVLNQLDFVYENLYKEDVKLVGDMSLEKQPKVSIIMGIYNCEETLKKSIESVINQTYTNWELIMCDDCSKDNTLKIAKTYENKYPDKIKVIKNEKNLTLGPTLNRCLKLASGKYISRQDGDDISFHKRLEKQVRFLEDNKEYDLVGTSMISFDDNGEHGARKLKKEPEGKDLMYGSTFAHATILIKKEVIDTLEGYSSKAYTKQVEDYNLWFRFFEKGYRGYNLEEPLYYVREDRNAYKRKSFKRRFNEMRVMIEGCRNLKLPFKYYLMGIKPVIAALIPSKLLMMYHRKKFKINDNTL